MNSSELLVLDLTPRESSSLHNSPKNARKASPMMRGSPSQAVGKDEGVLKRRELVDYSHKVWVSGGKTHGDGNDKGGDDAREDANSRSKARELLLKEDLKAAAVSKTCSFAPKTAPPWHVPGLEAFFRLAFQPVRTC